MALRNFFKNMLILTHIYNKMLKNITATPYPVSLILAHFAFHVTIQISGSITIYQINTFFILFHIEADCLVRH